LIKIEKLKYEIIKDILPEKVLHRINNLEKQVATVIKDIVFDLMEEHSKDHEEETKKEVKKVKIEFL